MLHPAVSELFERIPAVLQEMGVYPKPVVIEGPTTRTEVNIDGRSVIQFGSGNYLDLAENEAAIEAAMQGMNDYGLTSSGSRLVCGTQVPHLELEKTIAQFQQTENALIYFLVTTASSSVIPAVMNSIWKHFLPESQVPTNGLTKKIFFDWLSHPTLVDACRLAVGSRSMVPYDHVNMDDLEAKLARDHSEIKLIVTDGIFSTDGDLAPLPRIVELAERYKAMTLVDDAHGTGILGQNGRGIWEHFGVSDQVDFKIGSLAKAFAGGLGGFLACSDVMARYFRDAGGHYTFGGSIPPSVVLAIRANIQTACEQPWRRYKVLENAQYARKQLRQLEYIALGDNTPIVPIIVGDSEASFEIEREMLQAGFYAPSFRFPAVPKDKARIRMTMTAAHAHDQIDRFVAAFDGIASRHHVIEVTKAAQLAA